MYKDLRELINLFENAHMFRQINIRQGLQGKGIYDRQFPILNYIAKNEGCTQVDIAKALYISPASVAISTKRLQKAGLIQKEVDENSLRKNRVTVTEEGREIIQQCRQIFAQLDNMMFRGFAEDDMEALKGLLARMVYNLAGEEGKNLNPLARMAFINKLNQEEKNLMEENSK